MAKASTTSNTVKVEKKAVLSTSTYSKPVVSAKEPRKKVFTRNKLLKEQITREYVPVQDESVNELEDTQVKIPKKLINSNIIVEVISQLVGEDVVDLVIELITQDDYSEFKLAEKLEQDVNHTRNMLYRLLEHNFVTFNRRKDTRKGWYIYYWTLLPQNIEQYLIKLKEQKLQLLTEQLTKQSGQDIYFGCPQDCGRFDFDKATELGFHCHDCGSLLEQHDTIHTKERLITQISSLEEEISQLR